MKDQMHIERVNSDQFRRGWIESSPVTTVSRIESSPVNYNVDLLNGIRKGDRFESVECCVVELKSMFFKLVHCSADLGLSRPRFRCEINVKRAASSRSGKISGVGVVTTVLISRTDGVFSCCCCCCSIEFLFLMKSAYVFAELSRAYSLSIGLRFAICNETRNAVWSFTHAAVAATLYYMFICSHSFFITRAHRAHQSFT